MVAHANNLEMMMTRNPNIRGKDAIWTLLDAMPDDPSSVELLFESLVLSLGDAKIEKFVEDFCRIAEVHVPEFHGETEEDDDDS